MDIGEVLAAGQLVPSYSQQQKTSVVKVSESEESVGGSESAPHIAEAAAQRTRSGRVVKCRRIEVNQFPFK